MIFQADGPRDSIKRVGVLLVPNRRADPFPTNGISILKRRLEVVFQPGLLCNIHDGVLNGQSVVPFAFPRGFVGWQKSYRMLESVVSKLRGLWLAPSSTPFIRFPALLGSSLTGELDFDLSVWTAVASSSMFSIATVPSAIRYFRPTGPRISSSALCKGWFRISGIDPFPANGISILKRRLEVVFQPGLCGEVHDGVLNRQSIGAFAFFSGFVRRQKSYLMLESVFSNLREMWLAPVNTIYSFSGISRQHIECRRIGFRLRRLTLRCCIGLLPPLFGVAHERVDHRHRGSACSGCSLFSIGLSMGRQSNSCTATIAMTAIKRQHYPRENSCRRRGVMRDRRRETPGCDMGIELRLWETGIFQPRLLSPRTRRLSDARFRPFADCRRRNVRNLVPNQMRRDGSGVAGRKPTSCPR